MLEKIIVSSAELVRDAEMQGSLIAHVLDDVIPALSSSKTAAVVTRAVAPMAEVSKPAWANDFGVDVGAFVTTSPDKPWLVGQINQNGVWHFVRNPGDVPLPARAALDRIFPPHKLPFSDGLISEHAGRLASTLERFSSEPHYVDFDSFNKLMQSGEGEVASDLRARASAIHTELSSFARAASMPSSPLFYNRSELMSGDFFFNPGAGSITSPYGIFTGASFFGPRTITQGLAHEETHAQQFFSMFRVAALRSGIPRSPELTAGAAKALDLELRKMAFPASDAYRSELLKAWLRHDAPVSADAEKRVDAIVESFGEGSNNPKKVLADTDKYASHAGKLLQELDEPGGVETVFHELTSSKPELKLFDETPPELRDVFSGRVRLSTDEMRKALGVPLKRVLDKQNLMRTEAYEQYMGFAEQEAWAVEVRAREEAERALLPTKS